MYKLKDYKLKTRLMELIEGIDIKVRLRTIYNETYLSYLDSTLDEIVNEFKDNINTEYKILMRFYMTLSGLNSNWANIIFMMSHGVDRYPRLSFISNEIFGSKCIDSLEWNRILFPVSSEKINNTRSTIDKVVNDQVKYIATTFGTVLRYLKGIFSSEYTTYICGVGNRESHMEVSEEFIDRFRHNFRIDEDINVALRNIESLDSIIKMTISRNFLNNADTSSIDNVVEVVKQIVSGVKYDSPNINTFVEVYINSIIGNTDGVYPLLYSAIRGYNTEDFVDKFGSIMNEYNEFEKHLRTKCEVNDSILLDIVTEQVFRYITTLDIEDYIDYDAIVNIFNDSVNTILKYKYFVESEIKTGSIFVHQEDIEKEKEEEMNHKVKEIISNKDLDMIVDNGKAIDDLIGDDSDVF